MKNQEKNNQIIKRYRNPMGFYLWSIALPWTLWFISAWLSHRTPITPFLERATGITSFAGLLGPFAVSMVYTLPDRELRRDFFGRFLNFRSTGTGYVLLAFFLMPLSILTAQAISLLFGFSPSQFALRGGFTFDSALFPVWFLLIAAPVLEELAWHSYGTDCLRSRLSLFTASLLFAVFWALWHFPLSFIKGYYHSNLVEEGALYSVNFVISLIPFVLIMNWLYYKTGRNILLPIVFHFTSGFFNEIFCTHPVSKVIQTGLLLLISLYLLFREKELFFRRL